MELNDLPEFQNLIAKIQSGQDKVNISGLYKSSRSFFLTSLGEKISRPLVIITQGDDEAEYLVRELKTFGAKNVLGFPAPDPAGQAVVLEKLLPNTNSFLVTIPAAFQQRFVSPREFGRFCRSLISGQKLDRQQLIRELSLAGYEKYSLIDDVGQFSVRGEVLDLWPPQFDYPLRMDFFGDKIESIRSFNPVSQRSAQTLKDFKLIPAKPFFAKDSQNSLFDFLSESAVLILDNIDLKCPDNFQRIYLNFLQNESSVNFLSQPAPKVFGDLNLLTDEILKLHRQGYQVKIICENKAQAQHLKNLLPSCAALWEILVGEIESGFIFPAIKIALFVNHEIFNRYHTPVRFPKFKQGVPLESLYDLKRGDYIVHEKYGVGIYERLQRLSVNETEGDFLIIRYARGDKLYVPIEDFHLIQRYLGTEGYRPTLSQLDTARWQLLKERVRKSITQLEQQLLKLYAERESLPGHSFPPDSDYEHQFAEAFIYAETPDQTKAILEIKQSMQSSRPMDRLVCGDVGYGKTEVAMRAAFKAVLDGKQVAVLVPTTVLAEQHFNTFQERFRDYPVEIEMLSRFRNPSRQRAILVNLKSGMLDIIIGTHRLLQKDVQFKDLGLLITDEEHKFGVSHKEKLKQLRREIDVLTLTATPIPRTLSMSLAGIRDLSVIDTPPEGRLPVKTYIGPYDETVIQQSVSNELNRNGQVFFVHNRIETIQTVFNRLKELLPGVGISIAHGRMKSSALEKVMLDFYRGKFQILLTTTIIESGLDLANVNTLIIADATRFGLAQLYQLRGRIGRRQRRAYAYFLYPTRHNFTSETKQRLSALAQYQQLGAGFRLALEDLRIRGAGNILGQRQHGHIQAVGFELYCKLVSKTVQRLKGKEVKPIVNPSINLSLPAYIPEQYIPDDRQRILIYKKMATLTEDKEIEELKEELRDRYGRSPEAVRNLLAILPLRILARKLNIEKINQVNGTIEITFLKAASLDTRKILQITQELPKETRFSPGDHFSLLINGIAPDPVKIKNLLHKLL